MNTRPPLIASALLAASLISGTAHAALEGRDLNGSIDSFEAYYDTDLNITWLADANVNEPMTWDTANTWAAGLSIVDTDKNFTYDNWRLPTVNPVNGSSFNYALSYDGSTDGGFFGNSYNISEQGTVFASSTASEMAHLFYTTLNNKSYCPVGTSCLPAPQSGWGLTNSGPFTNLQADRYWSATGYTDESAPSDVYAWTFNFNAGDQGIEAKEYPCCYALAVSPGDVGIAAIPEPETYAMMLAGLGLVGVAVRRRKLAKV